MSIKAMLKYEQLMDIYDEEVANVNTPLDDWFGSNPEQLDDDEAILTVFSKELRAEPLNRRGAPARVSVLKGAEKKRGAMFHMFNQLPLPMDVLHGLREPDSHLLDRKAAREIRRQIRAFVHRQRTTRELWWS
ncbi:Major capsid protein GpE, partial [Durusdinium trenchii]